MTLILQVKGLDHLTERSLPYQRINFISIEELFARSDDVVVIIVVVAIIIELSLFLVARVVLALGLLCPPLLLGVVYLTARKTCISFCWQSAVIRYAGDSIWVTNRAPFET